MDKATEAEAQRLLNIFAEGWNTTTSPNRLMQKGHRLSQLQLKRKRRKTYRVSRAFTALKYAEIDAQNLQDYYASLGYGRTMTPVDL